MIATLFAKWIAPYALQLALGAIVALAAGGGFLGYGHHKFNQGRDSAFADVAAQNKEAVDAVNQARGRVRDCNQSGGVWSQAARQCQRRD